jgi:hypothetical protein
MNINNCFLITLTVQHCTKYHDYTCSSRKGGVQGHSPSMECHAILIMNVDVSNQRYRVCSFFEATTDMWLTYCPKATKQFYLCLTLRYHSFERKIYEDMRTFYPWWPWLRRKLLIRKRYTKITLHYPEQVLHSSIVSGTQAGKISPYHQPMFHDSYFGMIIMVNPSEWLFKMTCGSYQLKAMISPYFVMSVESLPHD